MEPTCPLGSHSAYHSVIHLVCWLLNKESLLCSPPLCTVGSVHDLSPHLAWLVLPGSSPTIHFVIFKLSIARCHTTTIMKKCTLYHLSPSLRHHRTSQVHIQVTSGRGSACWEPAMQSGSSTMLGAAELLPGGIWKGYLSGWKCECDPPMCSSNTQPHHLAGACHAPLDITLCWPTWDGSWKLH